MSMGTGWKSGKGRKGPLLNLAWAPRGLNPALYTELKEHAHLKEDYFPRVVDPATEKSWRGFFEMRAEETTS